MADIARLSLEIDTTGARRAQQALKGLQDGSIRATQATDRLTASTTRMNATSRRTAGAFKLQKGAVQQAGFQIGDFATQVGSGQSAMVAFGQQASQLAGILGPGGAVLGAVIAIGSAIAGGFIRALGQGEEATESITDRIGELRDGIDELTQAQIAALKVEFYRENRNAAEDIARTRERIDDLKNAVRTTGRALREYEALNPGEQTPQVVEIREEYERLKEELTLAKGALQTYFNEADARSDTLDELINGTNEQADATKNAREELNSLIESTQDQANTVGMNARETALYTAERLGANEADKAAIRTAYDQIEAERQKTEQQREARKQEQALNKMRAEADPAQAEFNRYADQIDQIEQFNITAAEKERLREVAFAQHQQRMAQIAQQGNQTQLQNQQAFSQAKQNLDQAILSSTTQLAGNIAGAVADMAGRQSDAYRVAFLAQQGFAIATSIINTQMAAVAALAPPPIGLGPLAGAPYAATIEAIGAANVGVIAAQTLVGVAQSYDGGGFTGYGSRSGGIDGKGGFPAILHPNETVIDHTRGQGMGGDVNVVINNAPAGTGANVTRQRDGTITIDMFQADMATGGPMSKTMQSTFGLRRQGR